MKVWLVKEYMWAVVIRLLAALIASAFIVGWLWAMTIGEESERNTERINKTERKDRRYSHGTGDK